MSPCWVQSGSSLACLQKQTAWVGLEKLYARSETRLHDNDQALITVQKSMRDMCEAIRDGHPTRS
jgi:hypothetical protein